MELKDILQQMMQESMKSAQLTDLQVGTVTSASPLEVTINPAMAPLRAGVLYLSSAVVEKKIPVVQHTHTVTVQDTYTGGGTATCSTELSNIVCIENGTQLPVENGYIILNRALETGDKVLLLRVQNGQKFIILSRVFEEAS
jgi:hypothetical protein|nr:MAG TPA: Protein of unknown function (DUF2577) [Caudoviricetes sp.]